MKSASAEALVVGGGLTAVFAAGVLGLLSGRRTLLVPPPNVPTIPTRVPGIAQVPMPVFPLAEPTPIAALLSEITLWPPDGYDPGTGDLDISVGFPDAVEHHPLPQSVRVCPGSYAEYATGVSLSQACKQFGRGLCATSPLRELRQKVSRHYSSPGRGSTRIGFIDGESAYNGAARDVRSQLTSVGSICQRIDPEKHLLYLRDGGRVEYGRLVYCAPLPSLGECLGLPIGELVGADAVFARCAVRDPVPLNSLRYDYRPDSPIIRVFVPTVGCLVAQLAVDFDLDSDLSPWLETLMGCEVEVTSATVTRIGHAYPLEAPEGAPAEMIRSACNLGDITPFGRYAEWRYLDLHELEWSTLVGKQ